jgi:hypothetical protein
MTAADLATWAQVVSSTAILITLVYLALENRQNTAALKANSRQSMISNDLAGLHYVAENTDVIASAVDSSSLTPEQQCRMHYVWTYFFRLREHEWLQYKNGVLDQETWKTFLATIPLLLSTEATRHWWHSVGRLGFERGAGSGFAEVVDELIESQPLNDYYSLNMRWADT